MTIRRCALLVLGGAAFVLAPDAAAGQEVAGDVMIPPPRELVTSTRAASGLGGGTSTAGLQSTAEYRAAIEDVVARVRSGVVSESEVRDELGDVMVSLLVRAGLVSFEGGGGS